MALFPKIQSPCPYRANLAAIMDGDTCRLCKRQVHDITDWSDRQRVEFLAGCQDEVCVSYRLPVRAAAAAAIALTALAAPMAAAAQDCPEVDVVDVVVLAGGIHDPSQAEMVETDTDKALPEIPVVYEDAAPATVQAAGDPGDKAAPVTKPAGA